MENDNKINLIEIDGVYINPYYITSICPIYCYGAEVKKYTFRLRVLNEIQVITRASKEELELVRHHILYAISNHISSQRVIEEDVDAFAYAAGNNVVKEVLNNNTYEELKKAFEDEGFISYICHSYNHQYAYESEKERKLTKDMIINVMYHILENWKYRNEC